jgi:hypothetical protein
MRSDFREEILLDISSPYQVKAESFFAPHCEENTADPTTKSLLRL